MRWSVPILCLILAAAVAPIGCDSDSFAPPAPKRPRSTSAAPAAPVRAKEIVLILPRDEDVDLPTYETAGRYEASTSLKAIFRAFKPRPTEPAARQAEMIRSALADGASALVVVPDRSKETADALASIDRKKTPVVLLGRPVEAPAGVPAYTLVTFPDFNASARKIVDTLAGDAKKAGFPADAPFLLVRGKADESRPQRDQAIVDALQAAKVPVAAIVDVGIDDPKEAKSRIEAALKAHPKIAAIIGDDDLGITQSASVRVEMNPKGTFLIGGYLPSNANMTLINMNQSSILVERSAEKLARRAILVANDLIEGKPVRDRVEVELTSRRAVNPLAPAGAR